MAKALAENLTKVAPQINDSLKISKGVLPTDMTNNLSATTVISKSLSPFNASGAAFPTSGHHVASDH